MSSGAARGDGQARSAGRGATGSLGHAASCGELALRAMPEHVGCMTPLLARLWARPLGTPVDQALVPLRVLAGVAMAHHGWGKFLDPFHWMDGGKNPAPSVFQALAAVSEFLGGLALALGLLTPLAAFGIACTMAVAVFRHVSKGDPFIGRGGSWELASLFFCVSALFLVAGPGRFSVDWALRRALRKEPAGPQGAA